MRSFNITIVCFFTLGLVTVFLLTSCGGNPEKDTFNLNRACSCLNNIECFAMRPDGRSGMVSTYDRSGGNTDWGDFSDVGSDGRITIADLKGPGILNRIWWTNIPVERWLFFFDGEKEPRIDLGRNGFFGEAAPFLPPLCGSFRSGRYAYMPLPYSKSLKVVLQLGEVKNNARPYYHVNYQKLSADSDVESFPVRMGTEQSNSIAAVRKNWKQCRADLLGLLSEQEVGSKFRLPPGGVEEWLEIDGGGVLSSFSLKMDAAEEITAAEKEELLREVVLTFFWDGMDKPSVEVPVGDFFCNGLHWRDFASMPLGNVDGTFICRFPMPFHKGAKAMLRNEGDKAVVIEIAYDLDENINPSEKFYFHSSWHQSMSRGMPFKLLETVGRGHYVGCYLISLGMDGRWNILEGDESMYVDGETTPSIHGTGLEDYFNGAWYYRGLYEHALCGLLEKAAMRTAQYRFHLLDRVPFDEKFFMNFEFGDANSAGGYISGVAYWYLDQPVSSGSMIPETKKRFPPLGRVGIASIMTQLFELERIRHLDEARERCYAYADKLKGSDFGQMLRLRALRYQEETEDAQSVLKDYRKLAEGQAVSKVVRKQAEDLLWFQESEQNALLGVNADVKYRIYLDGEEIGAGIGAFNRLDVFRAQLDKGEHELSMEITATNPHAWGSAYLRVHELKISTDDSWEYSRNRPPEWPETGGVTWERIEEKGAMYPTMAHWQFIPNAHILMQSGKQLIRPWKGWNKPPYKTAYIRKVFEIP